MSLFPKSIHICLADADRLPLYQELVHNDGVGEVRPYPSSSWQALTQVTITRHTERPNATPALAPDQDDPTPQIPSPTQPITITPVVRVLSTEFLTFVYLLFPHSVLREGPGLQSQRLSLPVRLLTWTYLLRHLPPIHLPLTIEGLI